MKTIALTFALPQESRDLIQALTSRKTCEPGISWMGLLGNQPLLVTQTGIGEPAATRAVSELLMRHQPAALISTGFAGALEPSLRVGDLVLATNLSASTWIEETRLAVARLPELRLVCGRLETQRQGVESAEAKRRLGSATGAIAVDMESGPIATLCESAAIPFLALRVISDAADQDLPVPLADCFDLEHQRPRPLALLRFLLGHPAKIRPFINFVRGLGPARRNLTRLLLQLLGPNS